MIVSPAMTVMNFLHVIFFLYNVIWSTVIGKKHWVQTGVMGVIIVFLGIVNNNHDYFGNSVCLSQHLCATTTNKQ